MCVCVCVCVCVCLLRYGIHIQKWTIESTIYMCVCIYIYIYILYGIWTFSFVFDSEHNNDCRLMVYSFTYLLAQHCLLFPKHWKVFKSQKYYTFAFNTNMVNFINFIVLVHYYRNVLQHSAFLFVCF